jgi:hypothetical protein
MEKRKMPKITFSEKPFGEAGIVGHVGVGHVHSHSGFVQDDSAGFAVAGLILKEALPADTRIAEVRVSPESGTVTVVTRDGGAGSAEARRGVTPAEAEIAQRGVGRDALFTQRTAVEVFGRMYGQGALELPVAFQGACALAVLDTFVKKGGARVQTAESFIPVNYDRYLGAVLDIGGTPVSLMLVVNGTAGGIGPDEDGEGNTDYGDKGRLMERLALDRIPSVVIESKAFIPALEKTVSQNQWMIRAQKGVDCTALGRILLEKAEALGLPARFEENLMPVAPGSLKAGTAALADRIAALAAELKAADLSSDKVRILADLNRLVSEDAGGVTFMSNSVNDVMRGAGTLPKITAVLSMLAARSEKDYWKIPLLTDEEAAGYKSIVCAAVPEAAKIAL